MPGCRGVPGGRAPWWPSSACLHSRTPSPAALTQYLEAIARQAGLDFLPQERKLPEAARASARCPGSVPATNLAVPWPGVGPGCGASARLGWGD